MDPQDLDFADALSAPGPQVEPDFAAAMTPKKRGRQPKPSPPTTTTPGPSSINNIYINKEDDIEILDYKVIDSDDKIDKNIKNIKDILTLQELTFLEIYFSSPRLKGQHRTTIDKAMISAGYGDFSQDVRYRIARKIVQKYGRAAPEAAKVFQDLGFGQIKVAQGIIDKAENAKSEVVSLNALALAAKCQGMVEKHEYRGQGINIIINTGPTPNTPSPGPGPVKVVIPGQDGDQAPAPTASRKPLQITR